MEKYSAKTAWYQRLFIGVIVYGILSLSASVLDGFLLNYVKNGVAINYLHLFVFSLAWLLIVVFGVLVLKNKFVLRWPVLYMYMAMMALIGPVGEVFINSFCRVFFREPLWTYAILPIHGGDTSLYSFFLWSLYGLYLYFLHQRIGFAVEQKRYYLFPSYIMAFDAIILEFLVNISSIFFLGSFIFYYFPSDVSHLTTLAASPFYFLGGIVVTKTIKRFSQDPQFFGTMSLLIAFVFVFLAN